MAYQDMHSGLLWATAAVAVGAVTVFVGFAKAESAESAESVELAESAEEGGVPQSVSVTAPVAASVDTPEEVPALASATRSAASGA